MKKNIALLLFIPLAAGSLMATSYSGPVKQMVYSSNRKFFAVIDPGKSIQNIYNSASPRKVLWSFSFSPEMDTWFVPDSGEYAVCIRWRFVRHEDLDNPAILVFKRDGSSTGYSYNSLVKARKPGLFETAPRGSSWRVWYESVTIKNNRVEIFTHSETRIVIPGDDCKPVIYRD